MILDDKIIEITKEQTEEILNAGTTSEMRYGDVPVRCNHCKMFGAIKNMKIEKYSLNDLCDVILQGKCSVCAHPVSRYIESGENEESKKIAEKFGVKNDDLKLAK